MDWVIISGTESWDSILLISTIGDFHIQPSLSILGGLVPVPLSAQDINICRCSSLYIKWRSFAYNLYLYIGYSRIGLHITLFVWIQHSAPHVTNTSLVFGIVWNIFSQYFYLWLVKCADVKPADMEVQLYTKVWEPLLFRMLRPVSATRLTR